MRDEVKKNTKDGAAIKKITSEGGLVPFDLTVRILVNALIATPSQVSFLNS
jgi:adenylate kinase family enzyme